ncbi:uncharacterized protein VICG_00110 [Vittaforma corneae ATCC 50505]|uniref:L-type lectin-like domain-containing protein n=1 Tax=Vittaforma corneae (strain ATCC 50505) TaxID=993615 RepID=L2GQJ9_VITCO|nr:uncharacterized protein VICG_00110 [Vittaforma corneae ATCC 50505]ELA42795.1 hypothetical protein VICG_00110 [Vittaforma corneae ATCC 50505]
MVRLGVLCLLGFLKGEEAAHHNSHVLESEITSINDQKTLEANSQFYNIRKMDGSIILRSSSGDGSLINIKEETTSDNWSTEFTVKNLMLKDIEKAGIYLWYLDKPLEKGNYKGGSPTFNGFVTGIEFSKERSDVVFAFNYGLDFGNKDMQTTRFDRINPTLIDHLDEFKVKIIHTEKNFKIELFDDKGNLFSDSFRIHEPLIMNKHSREKIFAITTKYEHCPSDIFFELKDLRILAREESDRYDMRDLHTEFNQYPRNKSDEELRLAIADVNHFMSYLAIVLGSKNNNNIVEMVLSIKKKLRILKDSLDSIAGIVNDRSKLDTASHENAMNSKINELESMASELARKIESIKRKVRRMQDSGGKYTSSMLKWTLFACVVFLVGSVIKTIGEGILSRTKLPKKE